MYLFILFKNENYKKLKFFMRKKKKFYKRKLHSPIDAWECEYAPVINLCTA